MTSASGDIAGGEIAGPDPAGSAVDDWQRLRASEDIQFEPVELPEAPAPPDWLGKLIEFLGDLFEPLAELLGLSWPTFKWILLGIAVLLLAWLLWRLLAPVARIRLARKRTPEEEWVPERAEALALLEDADRLAAEGNYDEATHLLLQRSVGQIAAARPDWLEPSSTAREIAAAPALPDRARNAFSVIALRVERSLFALRRLDAEDWQAARAAYADFALADLRTLGAS